MEFLKEIIEKMIFEEELKINIVIGGDFNNIMALALQNIKLVLENPSYDDFTAIEKIVQIFEELGTGIDYRHDFGQTNYFFALKH